MRPIRVAVNYDLLNRALYVRKDVGYSWRPRNLDHVAGLLESRGFEVERLEKGEWEEVEFVRDGSFMVLEDTLVARKGGKVAGFVTPGKMVFWKGHCPEELRGIYDKPVSLETLAYAVSLAVVALGAVVLL